MEKNERLPKCKKGRLESLTYDDKTPEGRLLNDIEINIYRNKIPKERLLKEIEIIYDRNKTPKERLDEGIKVSSVEFNYWIDNAIKNLQAGRKKDSIDYFNGAYHHIMVRGAKAVSNDEEAKAWQNSSEKLLFFADKLDNPQVYASAFEIVGRPLAVVLSSEYKSKFALIAAAWLKNHTNPSPDVRMKLVRFMMDDAMVYSHTKPARVRDAVEKEFRKGKSDSKFCEYYAMFIDHNVPYANDETKEYLRGLAGILKEE